MKKNKSGDKVKRFAKDKWEEFADWFVEREHPRSRLNKNVFFHDSFKLIGLILIFLIVYSNIDRLNQVVLVFIKLGSMLQLGLLFFILRKVWHLIINLKYFFRGLNHGTKAIIAIAIVLALFFAFLNQERVVESVVQNYEKVDFSKLNPIQISGNFSLFGLDKNSTYNILPKKEKIKVNPSSVEDCVLCVMYSMAGSCSFLEIMGESDGVSNIKGKVCEEACGKRAMEYSSHKCVMDKLDCYCIK